MMATSSGHGAETLDPRMLGGVIGWGENPISAGAAVLRSAPLVSASRGDAPVSRPRDTA
jgi:hypothetical protein